MKYIPFIQTVEILISRGQIEIIPVDQNKILTCLSSLILKYNKLSGLTIPDPVRLQIKKITSQLMEFDQLIRTTPYKDYWLSQATAFLFNLKADPLIMPKNL